MPEYALPPVDHDAPGHDRAYCMTCDNRACPGCGRYAPGHYGWCTPSLVEAGSKGTEVAEWGFPNFGMATKAHVFKPGRKKSACGKYDRDSVIVLSPETGERHPHVDCKTCAARVGAS